MHGKKIITAYLVEVRQFFTGLTSCRISASALNVVNFWSILATEADQNFCILAEFSKLLVY